MLSNSKDGQLEGIPGEESGSNQPTAARAVQFGSEETEILCEAGHDSAKMPGGQSSVSIVSHRVPSTLLANAFGRTAQAGCCGAPPCGVRGALIELDAGACAQAAPWPKRGVPASWDAMRGV